MNVATTTGRCLDWRGVLALILVPLLVAGGVLAGSWRFDDHLHKVKAAVVNNDQMVEVQGKPAPMGRQLAAALVDSKRDQNFTWVLADEKDAAAGLSTGQYAAVVRIPKEFSKNATSFGGKAADAEQATITIETSPVSGIAETALGQSVADAAASSLNNDLTRTYLDNVYIGFNTMGEQMTTVADGAHQLSDGAGQLDSGVAQASDGTTQLADGLGQAASGGQQLVAAGGQLSDGATQLNAGGAKLKDGGAQLNAGGTQLADGANQLAGGMQLMADQTKPMPGQIQQLADGTSKLAGGATTLADGTKTYTDGVGQYVDGVNSAVDPLLSAVAGLPDLTGTFDRIDGVMTDLPATATKVDTNVTKVATVVRQIQAKAKEMDASSADIAARLAQASTVIAGLQNGQTVVECPDSIRQQNGCEAFQAGVQAAGAKASTQLAGVDTAKLTTASTQLAGLDDQVGVALNDATTASGWLAANATTIQGDWRAMRQQIPAGTSPNAYVTGKLTQLRDGGTKLKGGGTQLTDGSRQLADGAGQLNDGVAQLNAGVPTLVDGIAQASSGASTLAGGVGQYTQGVSTYTQGAGQFVDGVGAYTDGVSKYSDGVGQLASGVATAHDGSVKLADGMTALHGGSTKLAGGTKQLSDGLAEGAKQIPSYSQTDRETLSKVVASPISTSGLDALVTPQASVATLLAVLALWLGALATYGLIRPVDPRNATSSATTMHLMGRAVLPGLAVTTVQAVLLTAITAAYLHLATGPTLQIGAILIVAGAAFALINHALAAWGGVWGRVASLAMLVVTTVAALTSTAPGVFAVLRPLSAASPALDATRAVLVNRTPALMVVTLLGWAVLGFVAGLLAIIRSRTITAKELVARA